MFNLPGDSDLSVMVMMNSTSENLEDDLKSGKTVILSSLPPFDEPGMSWIELGDYFFDNFPTIYEELVLVSPGNGGVRVKEMTENSPTGRPNENVRDNWQNIGLFLTLPEGYTSERFFWYLSKPPGQDIVEITFPELIQEFIHNANPSTFDDESIRLQNELREMLIRYKNEWIQNLEDLH